MCVVLSSHLQQRHISKQTFNAHGITLFYVWNNDKSSNKWETSDIVSHRCAQAIHIKKSGKNNFEIKPSPMAILQDKRRFSHPVHMLHESNFYFSREGRDVKIYVAKKFDFYCGQCVCDPFKRWYLGRFSRVHCISLPAKFVLEQF